MARRVRQGPRRLLWRCALHFVAWPWRVAAHLDELSGDRDALHRLRSGAFAVATVATLLFGVVIADSGGGSASSRFDTVSIVPPGFAASPTVDPTTAPLSQSVRVVVPDTAAGGFPEARPEPEKQAAAPAQQERRFQIPLRTWTHVTDRYGANRGEGIIHAGIDLVNEGYSATLVYAACEGTANGFGQNDEYGNYMTIDCGDGWSVLYAHLSRYLVAWNTHVGFDTAVARTGTSGFTTGEHLHFEIRRYGAAVNPENQLEFGIPAWAPLSTGPITRPETPTPTATPTPATPAATAAPETPTPEPTTEPTATPTPRPRVPTPTPTMTPPPTPEPTPTPAGLSSCEAFQIGCGEADAAEPGDD